VVRSRTVHSFDVMSRYLGAWLRLLHFILVLLADVRFQSCCWTYHCGWRWIGVIFLVAVVWCMLYMMLLLSSSFVSAVISLVTVLTLALWLLVLWSVGGYFSGLFSVRFLLTRGAIAGSRVITCLRVQCWHSTHSSNVSFISLYSDNTCLSV